MADLDEGSLRGVRVLDATQMLAGPLAATRLGDLGADVIKVEPPGGEFNRTHGFEDIRVEGEMSTFLAVNRNKRSFCVNLKSPEGLAAFLDLARSADVVLQNFRHGTADRLGIASPLSRPSTRGWSTARSRATARKARTGIGPART